MNELLRNDPDKFETELQLNSLIGIDSVRGFRQFFTPNAVIGVAFRFNSPESEGRPMIMDSGSINSAGRKRIIPPLDVTADF